MAVEPKRGCGYRKIGGLYVVGDPLDHPCERFPGLLHTCPLCGSGIKQSRQWQWVAPRVVFSYMGACKMTLEGSDETCPSCYICTEDWERFPQIRPKDRAGLMWVGNKHYPSPEKFLLEANDIGFSKRVTNVPRGFKAGGTVVFVAHPKGMEVPFPDSDGETTTAPAVIAAFVPRAVEIVVTDKLLRDEESQAGKRVRHYLGRGAIPVIVPEDDPDHQEQKRGRVWERVETEGQEEPAHEPAF